MIIRGRRMPQDRPARAIPVREPEPLYLYSYTTQINRFVQVDGG
jgi:hypothetical protein